MFEHNNWIQLNPNKDEQQKHFSLIHNIKKSNIVLEYLFNALLL